MGSQFRFCRTGVTWSQPEHMSFQCSLEISIFHVLPQIWWQGIPHTRTGSRETCVTEAVVCAWNNTLAFSNADQSRGWPVSAVSWMSEVRYVSVCPANNWFTRHASLNSTLWWMGSQCSFSRTGVIRSQRRVPVSKRAAPFCTDCVFCIRLLYTPYSSELQ